MRKRSGLHVALGLTALAGWLLFVLGCTGWSAWSQDGSKVLFTYTVEKDGRTNASIAFLDLNTGKVRTLFNCLGDGDDGPCSAQWRANGASALVFAREEGSHGFSVFDVPAVEGGVTRKIAVVEDEESVLPPVPEVNGSLYIIGKPIKRVDLETGTVQLLQGPDETYPFIWTSERMLYAQPIACGEERRSQCRYEIGEMTAGEGSRNKLFDISTSDPALGNPKEILPEILATDPERSRFAIVSKHSERDDILLYDRAGFKRILKLKMAGTFHLGNLQWARDGQSIFVSLMQPVDNDAQWSVAQVNLRSGAVHLIPITRLKAVGSDFLDTFYLVLQISLSPDGRTIAANTALSDEKGIAPADRGLLLIDVGSHDGQKVTRIPIASFVPPANK